MATASEEVAVPLDDRWSAYKDPNKKSNFGAKQEVDQGPDFSEYVEKILKQCAPHREQQKMNMIAFKVVQLLVSVAHAVTTEWKLFLRPDRKSGVKTVPLQALSKDEYRCQVPLARSWKPHAFQVVHKCSSCSLPLHKCHIQLNPALSREERSLVRSQWCTNVDKRGYLDTDSVLEWFNIGLFKACSILEAESQNLSTLRYHTNQDGCAVVYASLATSPSKDVTSTEDNQTFSVTFYPVFVLDHLPLYIQIHAPLPCVGQFVKAQKQLRKLIETDLESGAIVAVLEPKAGTSEHLKTNQNPTWQVNLSALENHMLSCLDEFCNEELKYQDVLSVFYLIREQCPEELGLMNNDFFTNTLFYMTQKRFPELISVKDWFLQLAKSLQQGFQTGFLQSFCVPRLNLLKYYHISHEQQLAMNAKLQEIIKAVKNDPKAIGNLTGYVDKKLGSSKDESDSESEESSSDDEAADNESVEIKEPTTVSDG